LTTFRQTLSDSALQGRRQRATTALFRTNTEHWPAAADVEREDPAEAEGLQLDAVVPSLQEGPAEKNDNLLASPAAEDDELLRDFAGASASSPWLAEQEPPGPRALVKMEL